MRSEFKQQIAGLQQGDHTCLIYEDAVEQMAAVIPFVKEGLARGERCAYLADDRTVEEVVSALAAADVDIPRERERGALILLTKQDAYLRSGRFDPKTMAEFLRAAVGQALAAGFTGWRITGEMTWALGTEPGCDRLTEYEAMMNDFFPNRRALALCQYNRCRFAPAGIRDVLRTHPVAILGDQMCPNPYYEPPDLALGGKSVVDRVEWMIAQLKRARAAQEQVQALLKEKEVLLREIYHRVKNNLQIVNSLLNLQSQHIEDKQMLDLFNESQNRIKAIALIHEILYESKDLAKIDFNKYIRNLTTNLLQSFGTNAYAITPTINVDRISLDIDTAIPCGLIINELVSNSARHAFPPGRGGEIRIEFRHDNANKFTLMISDDGIGFPKDLDLRNAESLGLQLVMTLVNQMAGSIELDKHNGTAFKIRFTELKDKKRVRQSTTTG